MLYKQRNNISNKLVHRKVNLCQLERSERIPVYIPIQVGWNAAGMQGDAAADWKFCGSAGPVYLKKLGSVTGSDQDRSVYGPAQGMYRRCESKFCSATSIRGQVCTGCGTVARAALTVMNSPLFESN